MLYYQAGFKKIKLKIKIHYNKIEIYRVFKKNKNFKTKYNCCKLLNTQIKIVHSTTF